MRKSPDKITREIRFTKNTQRQQPGVEYKLRPLPRSTDPDYICSNKLLNKVVIITGGDSGIGHSVAVLFAKEGADVVVVYYNEHNDALRTQQEIQNIGRKCLLITGNVGKERFCQHVIKKTIKVFGKIDILINNAAVQYPQSHIENITSEQLIKTFSINIFSYFYMIKAAMPFLKKGSTIINTTSITCYRGSETLLDYSATKGAIVALTRSLSNNLVKKGIRVNSVAPGPVWTPLIAASFNKKRIHDFGKNVPMGSPAQPAEIAPCYLFLASQESAYISGQVLHPNGGVVINGISRDTCYYPP